MVLYDRSYSLPANAGSSSRTSNNYLIAHDTGNDKNQGANSAKNEAAYMQRNWADVYTHAIAGWDRVFLVGEPGYVAYGAGAVANSRSPFQIELAHYSDSKLAISAYRNYIGAIREYAKKFGIPLTLDGAGNGVKSHKWVSDNIWGDHQDPYGYLARIGISKAQFAADIAHGVGSNAQPSTPASTPAPAPARPAAKKVVVPTVTYELHQKGAGWLGAVRNFGSGSDGFAGYPGHQHDALMAKVDHGSIKYRVHILGGGWLPFVTGANHNDPNNGYAGMLGKAIDGVEIYYITPAGEVPLQAWYRTQTVARTGYLGVVCDDGKSIPGYTDSYAGIFGEATDRLQIKIGPANPF
jgi:N-acetylmuramoyl-L-alanine amidase CwlA